MNPRGWQAAVLAAVIVLVAAAPTYGAGWGCWVNVGDIPEGAWPAHLALMRDAGMNTLVVNGWRSSAQMRTIIDAAIETGMLDTSIPIVQSAAFGPERIVDEVGVARWAELQAAEPEPLEGWYPGQFAAILEVLDKARIGSEHTDEWPQFMGYGIDEPGHGEDRELNLNYMMAIRDRYHAAGGRVASAVLYPYDLSCVYALDVVIACCIIGNDLPTVKAACNAAGVEFWTYHTGLRHCTPSAVRYHVGLWFWQSGARVNLNWDWRGMLGEQADMRHPQMNARLEGFRQGVEDYRYLAATEARLAELKAGWTGDFMPVQWWLDHGRAAGCPAPIDLDALLPAETFREGARP